MEASSRVMFFLEHATKQIGGTPLWRKTDAVGGMGSCIDITSGPRRGHPRASCIGRKHDAALKRRSQNAGLAQSEASQRPFSCMKSVSAMMRAGTLVALAVSAVLASGALRRWTGGSCSPEGMPRRTSKSLICCGSTPPCVIDWTACPHNATIAREATCGAGSCSGGASSSF